jgi:glutaredoxin
MGVTIYTKTGCPYCAAACQYLEGQGTPFEEINVSR